MLTRQDIGKLLAILVAAFPSGPALRVGMGQMRDGYHAVLKDLDRDLLMQAAVHYAGRHTFLPSAGQLRSAYWELVEAGLGIPNAQDAWAEVTKALSRGFYKKAKVQRGRLDDSAGSERGVPGSMGWDHPLHMTAYIEAGWQVRRLPTVADWSHALIQQAIDGVGGWRHLRTSDNTVADRARFIQAYEIYLERGRSEQRMLPEVREAVRQIAAGMSGRLVKEAGV